MRTGLDQFYTDPAVAKQCYDRMRAVMGGLDVDLSGHTFVEPSAGCGCFFGLLPQDRRIGLDLQPTRTAVGESEGIERADFLKWEPPAGRAPYAVIGNPPFGLRGDTALRFINRAATFADAVGFILPQLFASDGKGVAGKRVRGLQCVHTETLPAGSFLTPDGARKDIHTVFQVWSRVGLDAFALRPEPPTCAAYVRVVSLSDGGTPSTTRNRALIGRCDAYLPSTCFQRDTMRLMKSFGELPHGRGYGIVVHSPHKRKVKAHLRRVDWTRYAFRSTNGAWNTRRSLIHQAVMDGGFIDG